MQNEMDYDYVAYNPGINSSGNVNVASNDVTLNEECPYERMPILEQQFWIITVAGITCCLAGIVLNCFVLYILLAKLKSKYTTDKLYLVLLAALDLCVESSYMLTFPIGIYAEYMEEVELYKFWLQYIKYVYTVAKMLMTVSSYVIVIAAVERCIVAGTGTLKPKKPFSATLRLLIITMGLAFSVILWGSTLVELQVLENPLCDNDNMGRFQLIQRENMRASFFYRTVFAFWTRTIATTIAPFAILIVAQTVLWFRTKRASSGVRSLMLIARKQRAERAVPAETLAARRMLISVVLTYILCQTLSILITVWEFVDEESLQATGRFYPISTDVISILAIAPGTARLPMYYICNHRFRHELNRTLINFGWIFRCLGSGKSWAPPDSEASSEPIFGMAGVVLAKMSTPNPNSTILRRNSKATNGVISPTSITSPGAGSNVEEKQRLISQILMMDAESKHEKWNAKGMNGQKWQSSSLRTKHSTQSRQIRDTKAQRNSDVFLYVEDGCTPFSDLELIRMKKHCNPSVTMYRHASLEVLTAVI